MTETTKVAMEDKSANIFTLLPFLIKIAISPVRKGIQISNSGKV
jgi:hypothetical protein